MVVTGKSSCASLASWILCACLSSCYVYRWNVPGTSVMKSFRSPHRHFEGIVSNEKIPIVFFHPSDDAWNVCVKVQAFLITVGVKLIVWRTTNNNYNLYQRISQKLLLNFGDAITILNPHLHISYQMFVILRSTLHFGMSDRSIYQAYIEIYSENNVIRY